MLALRILFNWEEAVSNNLTKQIISNMKVKNTSVKMFMMSFLFDWVL